MKTKILSALIALLMLCTPLLALAAETQEEASPYDITANTAGELTMYIEAGASLYQVILLVGGEEVPFDLVRNVSGNMYIGGTTATPGSQLGLGKYTIMLKDGAKVTCGFWESKTDIPAAEDVEAIVIVPDREAEPFTYQLQDDKWVLVAEDA